MSHKASVLQDQKWWSTSSACLISMPDVSRMVSYNPGSPASLISLQRITSRFQILKPWTSSTWLQQSPLKDDPSKLWRKREPQLDPASLHRRYSYALSTVQRSLRRGRGHDIVGLNTIAASSAKNHLMASTFAWCSFTTRQKRMFAVVRYGSFVIMAR